MLKSLKNHADTAMVLGTLFGGLIWINSQFNTVNEKINDKFTILTEKISDVEKDLSKDLSIIKTVLIIKGIMPPDLIAKHEIEKNENGEKS